MTTPLRSLFSRLNALYFVLWFVGAGGAVITAMSLRLGAQIEALLGVATLTLPIELAVRRGHLIAPPIQWTGTLLGLFLTVAAMALVLRVAQNEDRNLEQA